MAVAYRCADLCSDTSRERKFAGSVALPANYLKMFYHTSHWMRIFIKILFIYSYMNSDFIPFLLLSLAYSSASLINILYFISQKGTSYTIYFKQTLKKNTFSIKTSSMREYGKQDDATHLLLRSETFENKVSRTP